MTPPRLEAGFADPVIEGQAAFRATMDAMARPGRIVVLPGVRTAPEGLAPAACAAILALCDFETPLWLSPAMAAHGPYLRFHTGAPLTADVAAAAFALVDAAQDGIDLARFAQGVPAYPDRSATIVAQMPSLRDGAPLVIAGPGIAATQDMRVAGLPADFARQWAANRASFPLGVDLILAAGDEALALPRSARIIEGNG